MIDNTYPIFCQDTEFRSTMGTSSVDNTYYIIIYTIIYTYIYIND